jgi:hypothetical protein
MRWRAMAAHVVAALDGLPGVRAWVEEEGRQGPQAIIRLAPGEDERTVVTALREGDPPIAIGHSGMGPEISAVMVTLQDGEERIVAERLRQVLEQRPRR